MTGLRRSDNRTDDQRIPAGDQVEGRSYRVHRDCYIRRAKRERDWTKLERIEWTTHGGGHSEATTVAELRENDEQDEEDWRL